MLRLSVLDQSPVRSGSHAAEALQESIALARLADRLGYYRYWVSEHHNIRSLGSAAPEVLLARLGAETSRIRIGSGGIMLPNHSALKVAENFRLLEALYPGRVDLGIGRAPGGDRLTAHLLNPSNTFEPAAYVQQLRDLQGWLYEPGTPDPVQRKVIAIPEISSAPELWLLTSSGESARLAAYLGIGLSFARFINPQGAAEALAEYRSNFRPSGPLSAPASSIGIFVFCADTDADARRMQAIMDHRLLSLEQGRTDQMPDYESIRGIRYTEAEQARIAFNRGRMVAGTPDSVKQQLEAIAQSCATDELIIATITERHEERLHSYELLASAFGLPAAG